MRNKIYLRIFFSFLIVISLYTSIIAIAIIRNAYTAQRTDTANQIKTSFAQNAEAVDNQFLAANNAIRTLSDDASAKTLAAARPVAYRPYAKVYDDIVSNPYFVNYESEYNVGVTRRYNSSMISSSGYFTFDAYLKYMGIADEKTTIKQFFKNSTSTEIRLVENDKHVLLLRVMQYKKTSEKLFFLVTWDKDTLFSSPIHSGRDNLVLVDTQSAGAAAQLPDAKGIQSQLNMEQGPLPTIIEKKVSDSTVFVRQSSVVPTVLFTFKIRNSQLTRVPGQLLGLLFKYFFALLVGGAILLILLSRRSFRPYARIIDELQQIDESVRPETAEALLERIHKLVMDNHSYSNVQHEVITDLKMLFLKNLLLDSYTRREIEKFDSFIPLGELHNGGVIALMVFSGISVSEEPLNVAERITGRKKLISALWPDQLELLFDIDTNHYAMIFYDHPIEELDDTLKEVASQVNQRLEVSVYTSISIPFKTIYQIPARFADVYASTGTVDLSLADSSNGLISNSVDYNLETETAIINNIERGNAAKALEILKQALIKELGTTTVSLAELNHVKLIFMNTLKRVLVKENVSISEFVADNQHTLKSLEIQTDQDTTQRYIISLYQSVIKIAQQPITNHRTLEEHIVDFINRRYQEDIGLTNIAEHYHLSESYASRVVKAYLGIPFKDYLAQIRIREAKEQLLHSDKKVSDIADSVGYKNVNTFIRVFKQSTGQTPGKYRQNEGK